MKFAETILSDGKSLRFTFTFMVTIKGDRFFVHVTKENVSHFFSMMKDDRSEWIIDGRCSDWIKVLEREFAAAVVKRSAA